MKRGKAAVNTSISLEGRICCCKRSACRKKYCECYRLNKLCTAACKCVGCCNKELLFNDEVGQNFMNLTLDAPIVAQLESSITAPKTASPSPVFVPPLRLKAAPKKEPKKKILKEQIPKNPPLSIQKPQVPITVNCISSEVVDSVIKCMLAQAQECVDCRLNEWQTERMILDTFDSCLVDILRCMGIQAIAESEAETILGSVPVEVGPNMETANETAEDNANGVEFTDLVESTTLELASLSAGDDTNSTLFVFESGQVKDMPTSSNENAALLSENVNPKQNKDNAQCTALGNLQFIADSVEGGEFDFESFTKMCQENTNLLDLSNVNVNEAIQFVEDESNLADSFEFSQI